MIKSKASLLGVVAVLALLAPAPSAEASELVKLGKLLVTGKRPSSALVEAKPALSAERSTRSEPGAERSNATGRFATDALNAGEPGSGNGNSDAGTPERSSSEPGGGRTQGPNSGEPSRGQDRLSHAPTGTGEHWA